MTARVARRTRLLTAACAVIGAAALPSTASAGILVESATSCEAQPLSQPFLPWLDVANYTPAPNGGLERGAADWKLNNAQVVDGNEPFDVADDNGTKSLKINAGGSATTRAMCVGLGHPTIRFVAKRTNEGLVGNLLSTLRIDVLYENHLGIVETLPVGVVSGTSQWQATAPFLMVVNLLPLLPGDHTPVAFRFVAQGPADWNVDNVFVDPWRGR